LSYPFTRRNVKEKSKNTQSLFINNNSIRFDLREEKRREEKRREEKRREEKRREEKKRNGGAKDRYHVNSESSGAGEEGLGGLGGSLSGQRRHCARETAAASRGGHQRLQRHPRCRSPRKALDFRQLVANKDLRYSVVLQSGFTLISLHDSSTITPLFVSYSSPSFILLLLLL